jgi:enoyl-CoA hydratase
VDDAAQPDYEHILYDVEDRVATITLNRPEVRNALNFALRREIVAAAKRAEADSDVTIVLLKGAGPSFCAGYDLKQPDHFEAQRQHTGWVGDRRLEDWSDQFARGCVRDWMNLWTLLKPVVVQVHGACLAGGIEIMSMADIVFVADDARLGYPPVRGLGTPDTPVFPWKMTMARSKYLQLTGNSITGKEAAEWGWVAKSFPAAELDHEVGRELHVLRNIDPTMLAANKMVVNHAYEVMGLRTHLEQSWAYHHLAITNRDRSDTDQGVAPDAPIRDSLSWINRAAGEVGIL